MPGQPPQAAPRLPPGIVGKNIAQSFKGKNFRLWAPHLELYPGELTYIGGKSGSGKSTLMKILSLEARPESGELWIQGFQISALSDRERDDVRGGAITYIPQFGLGLTDNISALETIQRHLSDYDGIDRETARRQAAHALQIVQFTPDLFDQPIGSLSGGQRARVAIARAYATQRPICLADEILPALDEESRKDILRLFQQLAAQQFTVAIIAHQPNLTACFHRVITIEDGKLVSNQVNQTVLDPYQL